MNWEQSDTSRLREYHQRTAGKLRDYLRSRVPVALPTASIEEVALAAKFKEGCEFMLRQLDDILSTPEQADDASAGQYTSM
jgi:hypothetical protein